MECHNNMRLMAEKAEETVAMRREAGDDVCLHDMPEGQPAQVRELRGCRQTLSRLCALGITPGVEITLCGKGGNGCRVQVRDTCVVLDGDCAGSILCVPPQGGYESHVRRWRCSEGGRHG